MKENGIIYVGVGIISLLLITTVFAFVSNSRNKKRFNTEQIQSDSLRNVNLKLQSDLGQLTNEQTVLTSRNDSAMQSLAKADTRTKEMERRISTLRRDNTALTEDRKQLSQLQTEKAALDSSYTGLRQESEKISAQNKELQRSLSDLETRHKDVTGRFEMAGLYDSDNFAAYGSRGKEKEKLTIRARCTKKLNVNFDVPQDLKDPITYTIITPAGTTINPGDQGVSLRYVQDAGNYTASLSGLAVIEQPRKVELSYATKEKLMKGEYKIEIFSNSRNIGNCRLVLK